MSLKHEIVSLLNRAKRSGIVVFEESGKLKFKLAQNTKIDKVILEELKSNKEKILEFLSDKEIGNIQKIRTMGESILPVERKKGARFPLSFSQERLWFIDQLEGSITYHMPSVFRINNELNIIALESSLKGLIDRQEIFRTIIKSEVGIPYQAVIPADDWKMEYREIPENTDELLLRENINQLIKYPFDLSKDYKFRATLLKLKEAEYLLVLVVHHIASDGWSLSIMSKELMILYDAAIEKKKVELPALSVQYVDYACWQRKQLTKNHLKDELDWWADQLKESETLDLPTDFVRPTIQSTQGATHSLFIDKELTKALNHLCQEQDVTMFMLLLSIFNVLMYRYTGQTDFSVGSPFSKRNRKELEPIVGYFINTIVLSTSLKGNPIFDDYLIRVKENTLSAFSHGEIPFEKIVERVSSERDRSRSPVFQVMFAFHNIPEIPDLELTGLQLNLESTEHTTSPFDVSFSLIENSDGINLGIEYCKDIFKSSTIERMARHFRMLLSSVITNPSQTISNLKMLTEEETHQILFNFNQPLKPISSDLPTVIDLFESKTLENPNKIALSFEGTSMSYQILNEKSNQLGHYLKNKGIGRNDVVGICISRSFEMIIGILGILKTGAAYLPIDPTLPIGRIHFLVENASAKSVISQAVFAEKFLNIEKGKMTILEEQLSKIEQAPTTNMLRDSDKSDLAYIIYTSGSTGKPKGVMVTHESLALRMQSEIEILNVDENYTSCLLTNYVFDVSLLEIFLPLIEGGKVVIPNEETIYEPSKIIQLFETGKVTNFQGTPSFLGSILPGINKNNFPSDLQIICLGGESLDRELVNKIHTVLPGVQINNHYGPTETSIDAVVLEDIDEFNQNNIGRPIDFTQAYITDEHLNLVPIGVAGELLIGGPVLGKGYIQRPELTKEKFIQNPFSEGRLYKSGDLVRWLENGEIEFIGRRDHQVKIRGFRIELGEIETILKEQPMVKEAIVITKKNKTGEKELIGVVSINSTNPKDQRAEANERQTLTASRLKENIRTLLPDYMIPNTFLILDDFPLTPNGKVDRNLIKNMDVATISDQPYLAARNEIEAQLVSIWEELLKVDQVGVTDNFFSLGGHSLLGMRLIATVNDAMNLHLNVKDIFSAPTIAELSLLLKTKTVNTTLPRIEVGSIRPDKIPLSYAQERLWFMDKLVGSTHYHMPYVHHYSVIPKIEVLESVLNKLVNRHEVLRTVFYEENGAVFQEILPKNKWTLAIEKPTSKIEKDQLELLISEKVNHPFNLESDYMFRATLIDLEENGGVLILVVHHIASDGWSSDIMMGELDELYNAAVSNRKPNLREMTIQYADYALWQTKHLTPDVMEDKLLYWKKKLGGAPTLNFPLDYHRPSVQSKKGNSRTFEIRQTVTDNLKQLCNQYNTTMFMMLLAVLKLLLYKYTGQRDLSVGSPIANRSQKELEDLIGFFANTIVLRSKLEEGMPFTKLLDQVKQTSLEAYSHQDTPFAKVVDAIVDDRDMSRTPLFQVMFMLQNFLDENTSKKVDQEKSREVEIESMDSDIQLSDSYQAAKFDLTFSAVEWKGKIKLTINYCTDLFKSETIDRIGKHFIQLVDAIIRQPETPIYQLDFLNVQEKQHQLETLNQTNRDYPNSTTFIDLFRQKVIRRSNHPALYFEDRQLSYQELDEQSNQLANYLLASGVKNGDIIALGLDRSIEMVVSLLAIMKIGGAYIPIDPHFPSDRIQYIIEDAQTSWVLSQAKFQSSFKSSEQMILLDEVKNQIALESKSAIKVVVEPAQLVYIIYTSGSTGNPKGVMIQHGSLMNFLYAMQETLDFTEGFSLLALTTYSFDIAYLELFLPLMTGASLVVANSEVSGDGFSLQKLIAEQLPSHMQATPATWQLLMDSGWKNQESVTILSGGEAMKESLKNQLTALSNQKVWNLYGPTETTIWSTAKDLKREEKVNIGRPIANTQVYILDTHQEMSQFLLVPFGVAGELCIGGAGLAKAYLNRPDLTAEKFVSHPFRPGERLYRTGDLARWLPNGDLECLGRIDDQVKVRGYRIEPGEIEVFIQQQKNIKQAIVVAREDKIGGNRLVAYLLKEPESTLDKEAMLWALKAQLPAYMLPSIYLEVDEFPMTPNGKIDKKALPDPNQEAMLSLEYVAPRNDLEINLVEVWSELLGLEKIGIYDNFFAIGGHSLLAIRLITMISKKVEKTLEMKAIFEAPTIAELAKKINQVPSGELLPAVISVPERPEKIPLSYAQERIWFIDKLMGSTHYHIPYVKHIHSELNLPVLKEAFKQLVNRHETLRTVLWEEDEVAYQKVLPKNKFHLEIEEMIGNDFHQDLGRIVTRNIEQKFDLRKDHMLRAKIFKLAKDQYFLLVVIHHISTDGWSSEILQKELFNLYEAGLVGRKALLPALNIQYVDFALWQRNYLSGDLLERNLNYWENQLRDIQSLTLPTDFTRPRIQSTKGKMLSFSIDQKLSVQLRKMATKENTTMFILLLTAFKVLIYRYSGQTDICIGSPIANRRQKELELLIGFFINSICLRSNLEGNPSFTKLLDQVKTTTLAAHAHQDAPFEKVVDRLKVDRDFSRSPLFQVSFTFQNNATAGNKTKSDSVDENNSSTNFEINLLDLASDYMPSKYDLSFSAVGIKEIIFFNLNYCVDLFEESTILRMRDHFIHILEAIVETPQARINELNILSEMERTQLLLDFNNTAIDFPLNKTVLDYFAEMVVKVPDQEAIVEGIKKLTYSELDKKSNQLANFLNKQSVKKGDLVAVFLNRSIDMIIAILGILKAGAAYVPIDPAYPEERIRFIIEDTDSIVILSHSEYEKQLNFFEEKRLVFMDRDGADIEEEQTNGNGLVVSSDMLAYIIYTSGSTGKPKGVMIQHSSLNNLVSWHIQTFALTSASRSSMYAGVAFDASVWEIWPYLSSGGTLHVIADDIRLSIKKLYDYFYVNRLTHSFLPTAIVPAFVEQSRNKINQLAFLLTGGDSLPSIDIEGLNYELVNNYGPTENTVVTTYCSLSSKDKQSTPLIGGPISNTKVYLLDNHQKLVPVGVPGEIYIGGKNLSMGYFKRPELNLKHFLTNLSDELAEKRVYKTGDIARWKPNGQLEFLGRKDEQVKIRGYRIELGEIEAILLEDKSVSQAVVKVVGNGHENKFLVAYIVSEGDFDKEKLLKELQLNLPDYMLPSQLIPLQELPLTPNGKIDKKALPDPDLSYLKEKVFVAPRNALETDLVEIWSELLGLEKIGIYDNFFAIGGHSLLAMRLISMIAKKVEKTLEMKAIFEAPTIAELAKRINQIPGGSLLPLVTAIVDRPDKIPLSYAQERLWFLDKLVGSTHYHIPYVQYYDIVPNIKMLESILNQFVNRHEVLRTVFYEDNGEVFQHILPKNKWKLAVENPTSSIEKDQLEWLISEKINLPFKLESDYMLRATLIDLQEKGCVLIMVVHHIASDGWSSDIMMIELEELYNAAMSNRKPNLDEMTVQYADYALWQTKYLTKEVLENKLLYWKKKLGGAPISNFPLDYSRPSVQSKKGNSKTFIIGQTVTTNLKQLCDQYESTMFMTLLAVLKLLLYKYTGQKDLSVGSPIANRSQKELENLVGFFANTIVLRSKLEEDMPFINLLYQIKQTSLEAYSHQDTPFSKVVDVIVDDRDMSRTPLFQIMFMLQNFLDENNHINLDQEKSKDDEKESIDSDSHFSNSYQVAKFDLTFSAVEWQGKINFTINYCTDLFKLETIDQIGKHFIQLVNIIIRQPETPIYQLDLLSAQEKQQQLEILNQTNRDYPTSTTFIDLFRQQVIRRSNHPALFFEDRQLSYQELDEQSNQLANYLMIRGVKNGDIMALCLDRSIEMVVSLLAIVKIGAAYIPIDPRFPSERIQYILEDAQTSWVLSQAEFQDSFDATQQLILLDAEKSQISLQSKSTIKIASLQPEQLAYIIYTSGSTGKPKGVMIEHGSLMNFLYAMQETLNFKEDFSLLALTTYSFDIAYLELYLPLITGASLMVANSAVTGNGYSLQKLITEQMPSHMQATPATWQLLMDFGWKNQENVTILSGGEAIKESLKNQLTALSDQKVWNLYGPTETTIWSTAKELKAEEKVNIGRPIANTQVYILTTHQEMSQYSLVPFGVPGELCIGGAGLARAYHNRPALTAEKFIPHPFRPGERLYRTGDLAKWLSNGDLECLGRIDDQVKVRGYRIEPGEIEVFIQQQENIKQAIVIAREDKTGSNRLVAYLLTERESTLDKAKMLEALKAQLPAYMLPSVYIEVDEFPMTPNGKIDKKALPDPNKEAILTHEYVAPRNELESALVEIWCDLLGLEKISIYDNFFAIGGHSLLAMRLITIVAKKVERALEMKAIFEAPTIAELAKRIHQISTGSFANKKTRPIALNSINIGQHNMFMVPPVLGTPLVYLSLAKILETMNINCFGFEYRGFNKGEQYYNGINDIVASYLKKIKQEIQNSKDEITLFGYSMGAIIAFELTVLLEAEGIPCRVVLLDSEAPQNSTSSTPIDPGVVSHLLKEHLGQIGLDLEDEERLEELVAYYLGVKNQFHFKKKTVKAPIIVVEAVAKMKGWEDLTKGTFLKHSMNTSHFGILDEKGLPDLASYCIQKVNLLT